METPNREERGMRYQPADDVVATEVEGELVLLHLGSGRYFGLNEIGGRIWNLVAERRTTDEIVALLLQEYDVEEPRLRDDVGDLLRELEAEKMVAVT